jgi:ectoine hydroxylase-related dioxygenase (phytanoyl-CoA dioxygenase family)
VKGPAVLPLFLHADQPMNDADAVLCNATYLLTDYTTSNGALCFVPGSHRHRRQPLPAEDFSFDGMTFAEAYAHVDKGGELETRPPAGAVAVEAPAGSLVVWHGNTWHGAFARTEPGLRVNLILVFAKPFLEPQERYVDELDVPPLKDAGRELRRLVRGPKRG